MLPNYAWDLVDHRVSPGGGGCQIDPWFQSWLHSQDRILNPVLSLCFLICQLVRILIEAR